MSLLSSVAFLGFMSTVANVAGHGFLSGIVADGEYHAGFNPDSKDPNTIGWITSVTDRGPIDLLAYQSPDIICHKGGKPSSQFATVAAGGTIELQWTKWPVSHKGPVLTYLAPAKAPVEKVDPAQLEFFKIAEAGLKSWTVQPGMWASDDLIANNNSHTVTIPKDLAAGFYVLRDETFALHQSDSLGAQLYPQCINIKVTGGGKSKPAGVKATEFYTTSDPGLDLSIYTKITKYVIPGPKLCQGAINNSIGKLSVAASGAAAGQAGSSNGRPKQSISTSGKLAGPYSNFTNSPLIQSFVSTAPLDTEQPASPGTVSAAGPEDSSPGTSAGNDGISDAAPEGSGAASVAGSSSGNERPVGAGAADGGVGGCEKAQAVTITRTATVTNTVTVTPQSGPTQVPEQSQAITITQTATITNTVTVTPQSEPTQVPEQAESPVQAKPPTPPPSPISQEGPTEDSPPNAAESQPSGENKQGEDKEADKVLTGSSSTIKVLTSFSGATGPKPVPQPGNVALPVSNGTHPIPSHSTSSSSTHLPTPAPALYSNTTVSLSADGQAQGAQAQAQAYMYRGRSFRRFRLRH